MNGSEICGQKYTKRISLNVDRCNFQGRFSTQQGDSVWSDCERNEEISHLCGAATRDEIQRPERQDEPAALARSLMR